MVSATLSAMDTALPPEPILPLIDELTDALVTGRVSPVGMPDDAEPWHYWSCSIDRRDDGYAISEWRIGWPVYHVEGLEHIRLEEGLSELLAYCDEQGISRPRAIQVFFNRGPEVQLSATLVAADGSEWECDVSAATEPVLQRLFQRWGHNVAEATRNQPFVRIPGEWWAHVNRRILDQERYLEKDRAAIKPLLDADSGEGLILSKGVAMAVEQDMLDQHLDLFRDYYTRGADLAELRDFVERWHQDVRLVFSILERRAGTPLFTSPRHGREYVTVWFTVDLLMAATLLGQKDIVRDVLTHPAISHAPYRAIDVLALIHGVPQASAIDEMRDEAWSDWIVHKPWLKVGATAPGRRQAAFEKLVREWQDKQGGMHSMMGQWCIDAALLAVVFGIDDSAVRDVWSYPDELVDLARDIGVQPLPAKTTLPGPWKKPTPPKVLEPTEQRQPHAFGRQAGRLEIAEFAALVAPVTAAPYAGDFDHVLETAVEVGTVVLLDWHGVDPDDAGKLLQFACTTLGLRVPGKIPARMPRSTEAAMKRFDAWLEPLGGRLLRVDIDSDDAFVLPVLVEDHAAVAGRSVDGGSLQPMRADS